MVPDAVGCSHQHWVLYKLGRQLFNVVDVIAGIGLILSFFIQPSQNNS
jgi:hypothetical protein